MDLTKNMPSPLDKKVNDLGLIYIPPTSQTDPRVPLAEEFSLGSDLATDFTRKSRIQRGWQTLPTFTVAAPRILSIAGGRLISPVYPGVLALETQISIPPLPSATNLVRQEDGVYFVAFSSEVGAAQDPLLGQQTFQYKNQTTLQIDTITKENSRRRRAFWVLVCSTNSFDPATFISALSLQSNGDRSLNVVDVSDVGVTSSGLQIYCKDPNLSLGSSYIIAADSVEILPVCRIRRLQNYAERGYTWGLNGESPLSLDFSILRTATEDSTPLGIRVRKRIYEIFSGKPGAGNIYSRSVQNLTSGAVAGNPGRSGESAGSPNNSVCLANDQRITYTNQIWVQKNAVQVIVAANDGFGSALVQIPLNSSMPNGTRFSESRADHKLYSTDGTEQSSLGSFSNLGGQGALSWIADANSSIKPGNTVFAVPGVRFPAGSGFSIPFAQIEQVWLNSAGLSPTNIRRGDSEDLSAYEEPALNEKYIVVTGAERASLHYIYKKVVVVADVNGVAAIPNTELGCFAFIEGIAGRIDAPVYRGLNPNASYRALIYSPPRSLENWQFQMRYAEYQGTGALEPAFLDGAEVISAPSFWVHTQGGGNSVFQGDASVRFVPITMNLPVQTDSNRSGPPDYQFDAPIQLIGESYAGPITFRELPPTSGSGLALPSPGQKLRFTSYPGEIHPRSLSIRLLGDDQPLGFRTPVLASRSSFQAVLAFAVRKQAEVRLVIATYNSIGGENVTIDLAAKTAVDTFRI